jgi:hypothetical protein
MDESAGVDERTPLVSGWARRELAPGADPLTGVLEPNFKRGLDSDEVEIQRAQYGLNLIEHYVEPWYMALLGQFTMPMSVMLEVSMIISGAAEEVSIRNWFCM